MSKTARDAPNQQSADRPNVGLIMADDMGFSDISPYGERFRRRTWHDSLRRSPMAASNWRLVVYRDEAGRQLGDADLTWPSFVGAGQRRRQHGKKHRFDKLLALNPNQQAKELTCDTTW